MTPAERALLIAIGHAVATRIYHQPTYTKLQRALRDVEIEAARQGQQDNTNTPRSQGGV